MQTTKAMAELSQLRVVIGDAGGTCYYNNKNELHRVHGPAVECETGPNMWFLNGVFHREDGPAIECVGGGVSWYINGKQLTEVEFLKHPLCTIA